MKNILSYARQAAIPVGVLFIVCFVAWASTGCSGTQVKINTDPATINMVLEETGAALGYAGLKRIAKPEMIAEIYDYLGAVEKQIGQPDIDVCAMIPLITAKLASYADLDPDWKFALDRASNLLRQIVQIDITIPENYAAAEAGLRAFIKGAKSGIQMLLLERQDQRSEAGGQRSELQFDSLVTESRKQFIMQFPPPLPAHYGYRGN